MLLLFTLTSALAAAQVSETPVALPPRLQVAFIPRDLPIPEDPPPPPPPPPPSPEYEPSPSTHFVPDYSQMFTIEGPQGILIRPRPPVKVRQRPPPPPPPPIRFIPSGPAYNEPNGQTETEIIMVEERRYPILQYPRLPRPQGRYQSRPQYLKHRRRYQAPPGTSYQARTQYQRQPRRKLPPTRQFHSPSVALLPSTSHHRAPVAAVAPQHTSHFQPRTRSRSQQSRARSVFSSFQPLTRANSWRWTQRGVSGPSFGSFNGPVGLPVEPSPTDGWRPDSGPWRHDVPFKRENVHFTVKNNMTLPWTEQIGVRKWNTLFSPPLCPFIAGGDRRRRLVPYSNVLQDREDLLKIIFNLSHK